MIKKKIKRLQNRSYKIKEVLTGVYIYINKSNNEKTLIYENVDSLYRKRKSTKKQHSRENILSTLTGISKYEIVSTVTIDISIFIDKLKNFKQEYSTENLIKKLIKDIRKSFNIDHSVQETTHTDNYFTKVTFDITANHKITLMLYHFPISAYGDIQKTIPPLLQDAELRIKRNKTIHAYL